MDNFFNFTSPIEFASILDGWIIDNCNDNNLGINRIDPYYIQVNDTQDMDFEYVKILKALEAYKEHYAEQNNIDVANLSFHFINWGRTELVYVLKNRDDICETILIKQPAVKMGKVKEEANNLEELKKRDDHVVAPISYFQVEDQELFTTPYIYQARCIAADNGLWGAYVPEPVYGFRPFKENIAELVCIGMIAKLVSLYDHEKNIGIGACRLSGGDFMLPKGWDSEKVTIYSILDNLYLIAAREMISCSFEEYLDIIRQEFSRYTVDDSNDALINVRGRAIMGKDVIEKGIKLGIEITPKEASDDSSKKYYLEKKPTSD